MTEKSALSQRFIELMNAQSKHENLAYIAELVEQQDYFNKMEKKEQMEEKMLSTFKVPCKAVTCLKVSTAVGVDILLCIFQLGKLMKFFQIINAFHISASINGSPHPTFAEPKDTQ